MTSGPLLSILLVLTCCLSLSVPEALAGATVAPQEPVTSSSQVNSTASTDNTGSTGGFPRSSFTVDSSMIQRALYVLIGITTIGFLYFLVRAVKLKKPGQKKKYGLLLNQVEMDNVDSEEDDTLFEARRLHR